MACPFSVIYCGGVPIPVDIEKDTWQMDVNDIEKKLMIKRKPLW